MVEQMRLDLSVNCDRAQGRPQVLSAWECHGRTTSSGRRLVWVYRASDVARASLGGAGSVQWKKGVYSRGSYVQYKRVLTDRVARSNSRRSYRGSHLAGLERGSLCGLSL